VAVSGSENDLTLERQLCFALSVASRSVITAYKPVLGSLELTHPQYLVMLALWERSPRSVKDISSSLLLEPATLSPLLKRLEASGLITRARDSTDERVLVISLTRKGAELRRKALSVPGAMLSRLGLSRAEAAQLHATMTRSLRRPSRPHRNGRHPTSALRTPQMPAWIPREPRFSASSTSRRARPAGSA
jgi:MarR family transcriptional regulator, organic hydroperoxide resistance regulator